MFEHLRHQWSYLTCTHTETPQKHPLSELFNHPKCFSINSTFANRKKKILIYSRRLSRGWICPGNTGEQKKQGGKKMITKADELKQKTSSDPASLRRLWNIRLFALIPCSANKSKKPKIPFADSVSVSWPMEKSNQLVVLCFFYNNKSTVTLCGSKHSIKWQCLQPPSSSSPGKMKARRTLMLKLINMIILHYSHCSDIRQMLKLHEAIHELGSNQEKH